MNGLLEEHKEACGNCLFHAKIAGVSACRRYPPKNGNFPTTMPTEWCGEYKVSRETMQKKIRDMAAKRAEQLLRLQAQPYHGHTTSPNDIVINGCRLICTCQACPEQYDVFDEISTKKIGYLRLRHGVFRADVPDCGDETIYMSNTVGDGTFEESERIPELTKAVNAIRENRQRSANGRDVSEL